MAKVYLLTADCRENGTRGRLGSVLVNFLEELLPDDIHERCRDKAYVAVTREACRGSPGHCAHLLAPTA